MALANIHKATPTATVNAGGLWESVNGGLSDALALWGQVETIKGIKSASGQDQQQALYQPELKNGASIQIDKELSLKEDKKGFEINKPALYVSLGLLGLAMIMRVKGF